MVELEELHQYRFYHLYPVWKPKCECGGMLWLHMTNGSVNQKCKHVGCYKEYEIPRVCTECGTNHMFEDITCDNCEPKVINIATWKVSIDEGEKAIKKINRAFKNGKISESDWKAAIKLNEEEIQRCQKSLQEI